MLENVYEGLNAWKCIWRLKWSKMYMKTWMLKNPHHNHHPDTFSNVCQVLKNVYAGLNARKCIWRLKCSPQSVFIEYFCEMYLTCVSSKLCEFIFVKLPKNRIVKNWKTSHRERHRIVKKSEHRPPLHQSQMDTYFWQYFQPFLLFFFFEPVVFPPLAALCRDAYRGTLPNVPR